MTLSQLTTLLLFSFLGNFVVGFIMLKIYAFVRRAVSW